MCPDAHFKQNYLVIWSDGPVLLSSEGPVDVERVLVEGQHEHDQDEKGVEDGEEKHGLVPQLFQTLSSFSLQKCKRKSVNDIRGKGDKKNRIFIGLLSRVQFHGNRRLLDILNS